jgi:phage protein D
MPSFLNKVPAVSAGQSPRGIVKVNGTALPGWLDWQFDNNSNYQADTFRVTYVAGALPKDRDVAWLSDQGDLTVEILAGFPKNPAAPVDSELKSYIIGRVDDILFGPKRGTIELSGRDFSSQFIDAKTTEVFTNQSVQAIIKTLAARHQMTANIGSPIVPPATFEGSFFEIDTKRLTDVHTEWDLLTFLAHETQCSVFVTGQVLNFLPAQDPSKDPTYLLQWTPPSDTNGSAQANFVDIRFSRNLTITKDVKVTVISWDRANGVPVKVTVQAKKIKNAVTRNASLPYGQAQEYSYRIPGLTKQQALVKAQALLAEISKHEMRLSADMPADDILTTRTLVTVQGTATKWDQVYFPDSVIRTMDMSAGYSMKLAAKNHSPETTVTL